MILERPDEITDDDIFNQKGNNGDGTVMMLEVPFTNFDEDDFSNANINRRSAVSPFGDRTSRR